MDTCEAVLDRLVLRGLVDDARLVRALILANQGKKAVSVDELRRRCAERGAGADAMALLNGLGEPSLEALLQRFERTERGWARASRFLASRGFGDDEIEAALGKHLTGEP